MIRIIQFCLFPFFWLLVVGCCWSSFEADAKFLVSIMRMLSMNALVSKTWANQPTTLYCVVSLRSNDYHYFGDMKDVACVYPCSITSFFGYVRNLHTKTCARDMS